MRVLGGYVWIVFLVFCFSNKAKAGIPKEKAKKMNVVFILTDDHGMQAGYLNTPGLQTPAMDMLAKQGIAFKNAYATFPSCSPSRASILTGTYPHVNGITTNVYEFLGANPPESWQKQTAPLNNRFRVQENITSLVEVLNGAGYYTGITYKFHIAPHVKFPFHFWTNNFNQNIGKDFLTKAGEKPFFLYYNTFRPHRPFMKGLSPEIPKNKVAAGNLTIPAFLPNTPLMHQDWAEYLTAIEAADRDVAEVIKFLKDNNKYESTLIVLMGDNGAPFHRGKYSPYRMGSNCPLIMVGPKVVKNVFSENLVSFTDIMPTVLDVLQLKIPKSVNGKSLKSLITGISQKDTHEFVISETAFPRAEESNYQARSLFTNRFLYIRSNGKPRVKLSPADMYQPVPWGNHSYQATVEAKEAFPLQFQLLQTLENTPPKEELFDMHSDPWCMHDISQEPAFRDTLSQLREKMDRWIKETGDKEMMAKN